MSIEVSNSRVQGRGDPGADRFAAADGTRLALFSAGAPTPGLTYLFAHGWTLDHRSWEDVVAQLGEAEPDAAIVTYDHRGHGQSDRLPRGTGTLERLADDLAQILTDRVSGPVVLAGHSMGGMTLAALGERHPELVRERVVGAAFIATSAGPFFPRLRTRPYFLDEVIPRYFTWAESAANRRGSDRAARIQARMTLFGRDARRGDIDRALAQTRAAGPGATLEFGLSMSAHLRLDELTPFARIPVAVLAGEHDRLCPVRHSAALARALPQSALTVFSGAGHMLPYERSAEVVGRLRSVRRRAALARSEESR
ncbi:putative hydrolase, alpha/beta hydrolase family [Nocardia nova SH22a]|uniref:Putative hydrolase, alpha/beta hydrolase family n=2 Tax=Nocardia nova TaxID=37330 RepID=W5TRX0_9NOCA|nr:putative hydrolase, alpha/beta hydrolase family [Nocardia nova SH22a]